MTLFLFLWNSKINLYIYCIIRHIRHICKRSSKSDFDKGHLEKDDKMCLIKHTQKTLAIKTYKLGKQDLGSGCETVLSTASVLKDSGPEHKALSGLHKNRLHRPWTTLSAKPRKHLAEELMQYLPSRPSVTVKVVLQHSIEQRPCCIIQVFCFIAIFPPLERQMGHFGVTCFWFTTFSLDEQREKRDVLSSAFPIQF